MRAKFKGDRYAGGTAAADCIYGNRERADAGERKALPSIGVARPYCRRRPAPAGPEIRRFTAGPTGSHH